MGRLGGVLGRLVASWKCLGASEDRNHCFLKVKSLKILIFEGFSEVLGGGVGWVAVSAGAGNIRLWWGGVLGRPRSRILPGKSD